MATAVVNTSPCELKTFSYEYTACCTDKLDFKLQLPIEIPLPGSTIELVQRVITTFNVPEYLEDDIKDKLTEFVERETGQFHDSRDRKSMHVLLNSKSDMVISNFKNWVKAFEGCVSEVAEQRGTTDEAVMATEYNKLINSPGLMSTLVLDASCEGPVIQNLQHRANDIKKLREKKKEQLELDISQLGVGATEAELNEIAVRYYDNRDLAAGLKLWDSELNVLWQRQEARHGTWLTNTFEMFQSPSVLNTSSISPLATFLSDPEAAGPSGPPAATPCLPLQESVTIHLGCQLLNIKLVTMDMKDVITGRHNDAFHRLKKSLSPCTELCGSVLFSESAPPNATLVMEAASANPEQDIADVQIQLRNMTVEDYEPAEDIMNQDEQLLRELKWELEIYMGDILSNTRPERDLQTGDILVTTHINLNGMYFVYHLIVDDSKLRSDITTRHPAILGLRNILISACANDVTSLSIPLLLRQEMSEEMTEAWCLERAKFVLTYTKDFMLDMTAWEGADLRVLQFVLPPSTAPSLFATLAQQIRTIFRPFRPV